MEKSVTMPCYQLSFWPNEALWKAWILFWLMFSLHLASLTGGGQSVWYVSNALLATQASIQAQNQVHHRSHVSIILLGCTLHSLPGLTHRLSSHQFCSKLLTTTTPKKFLNRGYRCVAFLFQVNVFLFVLWVLFSAWIVMQCKVVISINFH